MLHRDIKPDNVLLSRYNEPVLAEVTSSEVVDEIVAGGPSLSGLVAGSTSVDSQNMAARGSAS